MRIERRPPPMPPGPPSVRYRDYWGALVPDKAWNEAAARRHAMVMLACRLIAGDRRAEG